jgi:putative ABC transport system permease protein
MISYYIKIALRNLFQQKFYAAINIFGLGIGLAGCFIIVLFVLQELSYDTFHKDAEQIYRVNLFSQFGW